MGRPHEKRCEKCDQPFWAHTGIHDGNFKCPRPPASTPEPQDAQAERAGTNDLLKSTNISSSADAQAEECPNTMSQSQAERAAVTLSASQDNSQVTLPTREELAEAAASAFENGYTFNNGEDFKHGFFEGYDACAAQLAAVRQENQEMKAALEKIASCPSVVEGDCPSIAKAALASLRAGAEASEVNRKIQSEGKGQ